LVCYYRSDVHPLSLCSMCHYFFLSLHLLHLFSLPLASIFCPGFAQLVPVMHHSALPVSCCYSTLPCPMHMSPTCPLSPQRLLTLSVLTLFLVLLDTSFCVCVYVVILHRLCRLATLVVFFFVCVHHRGRLLLFSFIFGPSLRCITSVVCLGSLSATSLSLPFSVSVTLLSPLLSSARPTTFAFAAPLSFTVSVAVVSFGPSSSEVYLTFHVCMLFIRSFLIFFLFFLFFFLFFFFLR